MLKFAQHLPGAAGNRGGGRVWKRGQKPHKSEASINFRTTAKFKIVYKATQDAATAAASVTRAEIQTKSCHPTAS